MLFHHITFMPIIWKGGPPEPDMVTRSSTRTHMETSKICYLPKISKQIMELVEDTTNNVCTYKKHMHVNSRYLNEPK